MFSSYFIVLVQISLVLSINQDYAGYKVYNVKLESEEQQNNFDLIKGDEIDYWRKPSFKHGVTGQAMVAPSHLEWFEEQLEKLGLDSDLLIADVNEYLLEKEAKLLRTRRSDPEIIFDYTRYYRYDEILSHMRNLVERYEDSDRVSLKLVELGKTHQERDWVYLKLTRAGNNAVQKPVVIIEGGIIPREWITIPAALYVLDRVLEESQSTLLDKYDWIFIPVVNPDGYEYTHTNLRLWTKTLTTKSYLDFICPGAHINRNFNIDWSVSDSSSSPCSHLFAGVSTLSEIEARMVTSIIDEYGSRIRIYISLQNSGGFISFPWQYEKAACGLFRQHLFLSREMAAVMSGNYSVDVASLAYGDRASGSSTDYARQQGGWFTFNLDIEQRGDHGVHVAEEDIVNITDDVWKAVAVAAENAEKYIS